MLSRHNDEAGKPFVYDPNTGNYLGWLAESIEGWRTVVELLDP